MVGCLDQGASGAATHVEPAGCRASGSRVAVVGADGHVRLKPVTVSRDLGTTVQVATGLSTHDQIIDNPPDALADGDQVKVVGDRPARG